MSKEQTYTREEIGGVYNACSNITEDVKEEELGFRLSYGLAKNMRKAKPIVRETEDLVKTLNEKFMNIDKKTGRPERDEKGAIVYKSKADYDKELKAISEEKVKVTLHWMDEELFENVNGLKPIWLEPLIGTVIKD